MSAVTASITIDAAPARVFATVMDPQRLRDWVTIHRSVTILSPDPSAQGSQMDQVLALCGVPFTVHWTLTSVSVPREAEWQGRGPAGSRAFIRYRLTGPDTGPTTLEYTNDFSTPGGLLGNRASKLVVGSARRTTRWPN
jgi:hypothetical protein